MFQNLSKDCLIKQVINGQTAGTSVVTGTSFSIVGYQGLCLICSLGTLSANEVTTLELLLGNASNGSDAVEASYTSGSYCITSSAVQATDSNKLLIVDGVLPMGYQYATPQVNRATGNAVINCVIAILYNANTKPVALDTTVSQAVFGVIAGGGTLSP